MRLCFLADPHHPNTDRWASYFAETLRHEVMVLATTPGPYRPRPYAIVSLPIRSRVDYLTLGFRIKGHLRRARSDVLIGYRIQSHGLAAALSGFRPLVLAAQSETIAWPPTNPIAVACVRFAIRRADLLQAWGNHIARRMEEFGADRSKILVLPRGVELDIFKPPPEPVLAPVLIVTRALRAVYRHAMLFEAFREVSRHVPSARLVVAGDGAERDKLKQLAVRLGLDSSVDFLGQLGSTELAIRLREARCYVTLVATEGVSSSLLEAMACGLVPIVPDLPGNRDWVNDGENGVLVPLSALDDPGRIAQFLLRAISNDALRRQAFQTNVGLASQRADWHANMRQMESAYLGLVTGGS